MEIGKPKPGTMVFPVRTGNVGAKGLPRQVRCETCGMEFEAAPTGALPRFCPNCIKARQRQQRKDCVARKAKAKGREVGSPRTTWCAMCGEAFEWGGKGRKPAWCPACRLKRSKELARSRNAQAREALAAKEGREVAPRPVEVFWAGECEVCGAPLQQVGHGPAKHVCNRCQGAPKGIRDELLALRAEVAALKAGQDSTGRPRAMSEELSGMHADISAMRADMADLRRLVCELTQACNEKRKGSMR